MSGRPLTTDEVASFIATMFSVEISTSLLEELSTDLELLHLDRGETLMRQGEPGNSMYAVIGGRLRAYVSGPDGVEHVIGEVGVGERVGEMALIRPQPRSATVRAIRDTELVGITRDGFERLVAARPGALLDIVQETVDRVTKLMHDAPRHTPIKTIAIVAIDDQVDIGDFVGRLTQSLAPHGKVARLDRDRFDREQGAGAADLISDTGTESRRISAFESQLEAANTFVLYEADRTATSWTSRCLGQADRILLVGRAAGPGVASPAEQALAKESMAGSLGAQELVLLHETGSGLPTQTERWLADRDVVRHAHVRLDRTTDFDRLGRLLAGQAVGVALGGGGARGFAHIGVLRALEEAAVPVDVIGGVSMGAIIAAQYAMGHSYETMVRENRSGIADSHVSRDVTLPIISLNSGRKFTNTLRSFFGDTQIEDLWLPYLCVSCNLTTADTVVHRSGRLWWSVKASNAAPGVFPPVPFNGDLLVDGGLVNNEPGDVVKRMSGGPVVVVNVSPRSGLEVDPAYETTPTPWAVLGHQLSPFHERLSHPGITGMIMRSIMVGSRQKSMEVEELADYYLRPPVEEFRVDDYSRIEEIADVGYHYAMEQMSSLQDLRRP